MKWLSFLLTASTAASSPIAAAEISQALDATISVSQEAQLSNPTDWLIKQHKEQSLLEEQAAYKKLLKENRIKLDTMVAKLQKTVGKTWYVFSGASPSGWDCSGLVLWAYEQVGITLEHRATLQAKAGKVTDAPTPGDIVAFTYNKSKSAYHTGIYIGDGLFIHSPRKGEVTRIESVEQFAGNYSTISYRNLLDN